MRSHRSRILAGIPTRLRNTSGPLANVLAQVVDEVVVISQGATCEYDPAFEGKVTILEKPVDYGLVPARNDILLYANDNDYDYVIQSDDDLAYKPELIKTLIQVIVAEPMLGTLASSSRAYFHWDAATRSNRPFLLSSCGPQLWIAPTRVLNEVGLWFLEYLEDRDYGARMWGLGWAIGKLHVSLNLTHNPFIARVKKDTHDTGGQAIQDRKERLGRAIAYMNQHYSDILQLKQMERGNRTFSSRYHWNTMLECFRSRWYPNRMGYEDSKGRFI